MHLESDDAMVSDGGEAAGAGLGGTCAGPAAARTEGGATAGASLGGTCAGPGAFTGEASRRLRQGGWTGSPGVAAAAKAATPGGAAGGAAAAGTASSSPGGSGEGVLTGDLGGHGIAKKASAIVADGAGRRGPARADTASGGRRGPARAEAGGRRVGALVARIWLAAVRCMFNHVARSIAVIRWCEASRKLSRVLNRPMRSAEGVW